MNFVFLQIGLCFVDLLGLLLGEIGVGLGRDGLGEGSHAYKLYNLNYTNKQMAWNHFLSFLVSFSSKSSF